jgi:hypothetical protein
MNLTLAAQIAQIVSVTLILPIVLWRAWRSFDRRIDAVDKRTVRIEAQFFRNGGSSMKDDIVSLKEGQANIKGHLGLD